MATVSPSNIMRRLSFGMLGGADTEHFIEIRSYLVKVAAENRRKGEGVPTRQMVYKWFAGANPTQETSIKFLADVIENFKETDTRYVGLPPDQKKVLNQISRDCRSEIRKNRKGNPIHNRFGGDLQIRQNRIFSPSEIKQDIDNYVGFYNIFRYKFGKNRKQVLAVEVLQIEKVDTQLYATMWFLIDEIKLYPYEGGIIFVGNSLWIIAHNSSLGGRLRAICFDRVGWGRVPYPFYTGILLSTTPDYHSPRPAACRIVIEKIENSVQNKSLEKFVYFTSKAEFSHPRKKLVLDLIDNTTKETDYLAPDIDLVRRMQDQDF